MAEITSIIANAGVDVRALSIPDTTDFGILRLIVNKPDEAEKALKEAGDKIDAGEKANVEADLTALKDLLERTKDQELNSDQVAEIKAAQEKLMTGAQSLFAKMYEQAQGAQAGADMSGMGGAASDAGMPEDDIIDGDFREV